MIEKEEMLERILFGNKNIGNEKLFLYILFLIILYFILSKIFIKICIGISKRIK